MATINVRNISDILPDEPIPDQFEEEIHFNNTVREYIVFGFMLLILSIVSHVIVLRYRRKDSSSTFPTHPPRHNSLDDDEAVVDRVALWLCTFSLAVSLGAVLLLPISILGNEVLTLYQDSLYVRWINLSLIQGMWNMIFLFSNLSLFVALPFAYLFTESEGFSGSKKGLRARILETVVVLMLVVVLVFGVAFILCFLLGYYEQESLGQLIDVWGSFYLPFLYSLISCLGVLILLLCTPVGIAHLFSVIGGLVLRPRGFLRDLRDLNEEYNAAVMEERSLAHRLDRPMRPHARPITHRLPGEESTPLLRQFHLAKEHRLRLERRHKAGVFRRNLAYPLVLVTLLLMTSAAVFIVCLNTLQLVVGIKNLPLASAPTILGEAQQGKRSVLLSVLGSLGAAVEVILIFYLIVASMLGYYSLPLLGNIRPRRGDTPMLHIIANCVVVLVLSSALPLLACTLGITNFDLLGDYGRISWLGNFWIVLGYNVLFATAAARCLVKKFTATLRREIYLRFKQLVLNVIKMDAFKLPPQMINSSTIMNGGNVKED